MTKRKHAFYGILALVILLGLGITQSARANLITNPGFETGNFTGWTHAGGVVIGTFDGVSPHSGNFQAALGIASLTQSVATTIGQSYTIDFWVAYSPSAPNSFSVSWGGVTIFTLTNQSAFGYTHYTFTETASTASTALQFQTFTGLPTWLLDDVSVNPAGVGVPDGGSTVSLLGCALLGLTACGAD